MRRALRNRTAVITGASSGVGRAIARLFGAEGARVALIARNHDGLQAAASEIQKSGGEALVLPLDVADAEAVAHAGDTVRQKWGGIDIWVNNAMVTVFSPVIEMQPEEYRRVMEVNYLGFVHGTLTALRHMRPRDRGLIMQIGSALAYRSIPLQSAYCASKAAIRGFTDSLRSELIHARSHVQLTMLHLPAVNTPQFDVARNRMPEHPQPVPPIYQPEVIARAALYSVLHPRREMWIGWSATKAILGQRIAPGLLDRYLARHAWKAQETSRVPPGHPHHHRRDNLEKSLPGDRGAHGVFDSVARSSSSELFFDTHRGALALLATLTAGAFVAAARIASRR
jgi:short-subunit dehydrogenase